MTRSILSVVDIETTGLREDDDVWEVALLRVLPDGEFSPHHWLLKPDLAGADSTALRMTRFYERLPADPEWTPGAEFAEAFCRLTAGTHLVGACPDFDARRLERLVRDYDFAPAWNYHLVDVEALIAGWLGLEPPWSSRQLQELMGVEVDETDKHTATGDVWWAWRLYSAWRDAVRARDQANNTAGQATASGSSTVPDGPKTGNGPSDEGTKPVAPQVRKGRKSRGRGQTEPDLVIETQDRDAPPPPPPPAGPPEVVIREEAAAPAVKSPGSAEAADAAPSDPSPAPTVEGAPAEHTQTEGATQTPPPEPVPAGADEVEASPAHVEEQPWGVAPEVIAAVVPKAKAAAVAPPATEEPDPPDRRMPGETEQFTCEGGCGNLTELPSKPGRPSAAQVSYTRLRMYLCWECTRERVG